LKELHGVRWIAVTYQVVSVGLIAVALLVVVAQAVGLPERLDVLLYLVRSLLREAIVASALHELLVVARPAGFADGLDEWEDLLFQAVGALCSQPLHRLKSLLQLVQEGVEAFVELIEPVVEAGLIKQKGLGGEDMEGPKSVGDSEGDLFAPPLPFCLAVAHTYKDIYEWHCEVGLALAALRIHGVLRFSDLLMRRVSRRTRRCRDD
jgi:hypothetical protein